MNHDSSNTTSGINIGNYKGVMLCNRPFNSVTVHSPKHISQDRKLPFITGVVGTSPGQNVPIFNEQMHIVKRDKKNNVLSKHKKWLYDLQKERERLEEALREEAEEKEEQKKRFTEKEAKLRMKIRTNHSPEIEDILVHPNSNSNKKIILNKPAWALTEENAIIEKEKQDELEIEDLIEFTNNLDLDKFIQDTESKATIEQLKQRMEQLEHLINNQENDERHEEILEKRKEIKKWSKLNAKNLALLMENNMKDNNNHVNTDDTESLASTVLSECKSIRSIHSSKSVAAITKKVQEKLIKLESISENNLNLPKVIVHDEENGARILNKKDIHNLPYMHRNPSI